MSLTPGERLGPYEVIAKLGEGGMGEVYRARDTQLDRDVALKILPRVFAADAKRLARFEREAKTLAALNHPNIASIYGLEKTPSTGAAQSVAAPTLVMEFVPGRTLDQLIGHGPLPPESVVKIAAQIAEGLEAAHEAGIVHRDLKPANIKYRDDDVVKLLDFGLARAMDSAGAIAGAAADTMSSPTLLSPAATQQGVILGTAGYMSPEQAKGRVVDKRTDIWAFGAVVYEMLTGKRLFAGETVTEILAAIIRDTPDLQALPAGTPPALRQVVTRCLERDPKLRLRDIGEARVALSRASDPLLQGPTTADSKRPTSRAAMLAAAAGALALAAIAAAAAWNARPESTVPVRRFELPGEVSISDAIALAPGGNLIAYLANGHLFTRALDTGETKDLQAVPAGAQGLFFSPDGKRIVYGAESMLRIVPVEGGPEFELTKVPASGRVLDGVWLEDGTVVFVVWREGAYKVPATGGTAERLSAIDPAKEIDFHSVTPLPDGRLVATTHLRGQDAVRAEIVNSDGTRTAAADDLNIDRVRFRAPDQLLFSRVRDNIGVWTAPLKDGRMDLAKAVVLQPGASTFDVSAEGTLLTRMPPQEHRNLVWVQLDERGVSAAPQSTRAVSPVAGSAFESLWSKLAVSRDGRRAAVAIRTPAGQDELFVRDLTTGVDTRIRLPPEAATRTASGLVVRWSQAGRLLVGTGSIETSQIFDVPADGSGGGRRLVEGTQAVTSPDGRELIFNREERAQFRLYRAPIQPDGSVGKAEPVFAGSNPPNANAFDLSPDGRLLAFTDREPVTAALNVFVATYPDVRERRQVTAGGTQPRFSRDGRQLFFIGGARTTAPSRSGATVGELRVVDVTRAPFGLSAARVLMNDQPGTQTSFAGFDVGPDRRLLMTSRIPSAPGDEGRVVLLQNWPLAAKITK